MDNKKTLVPEIGTPLTRVDLKNLTGGLPFSMPDLIIFSDSAGSCTPGKHCSTGIDLTDCQTGSNCNTGTHDKTGGATGPSKDQKTPV